MGAAAEGDTVGVAGDKTDAVARHAEPLGDELRKARLMTLALRSDADDQLDEAVGRHGDLGLFARYAGGDIDIGCDTDAAALAALLGFLGAGLETFPVAKIERHVHGADIVAIIVFGAERIPVRQLFLGHEVLAAERDAVIAAF